MILKKEIKPNLDLRYLKMDEVSCRLTMFATPFGRSRWKVFPFRNAPASEIFQKTLYNTVTDLEGMVNKADDLLVVRKGKTMKEIMVDHNK